MCVCAYAQKGKEYFLIDSINYETLSQDDKYMLDSLLPLYHKAKHDTSKLRILETLDESLNDESVWPRYNKLMYAEVENHLKDSASLTTQEVKAYKKYFATALQGIGYCAQYFEGNSIKALEYYNRSMKINEEVGDKLSMATTLSNIGGIYLDKSDIKSSLEYIFKALKIQEEIKDDEGIAYSLDGLTNIFIFQRDTAKALECLEKSMKIRKSTGDKRGYTFSLNSAGVLYSNKGELEKALGYYMTSLDLCEQIGEKAGLGNVNQAIGSIYLSIANKKRAARDLSADSLYSTALNYLMKGLKYSEEVQEMYIVSTALTSIGKCYLAQKKLVQAIEYGQRALRTAKKLEYADGIKISSLLLYEIYRNQGKWQNALAMHELYVQMSDSVFNQETQKSTFKQQTKYEYEKQQVLKDAEHQKELAVAEEEKKQQRIVSYAVGLGLLLVAIFSVIIFNRLRVTRKQKIIIEQKNKHITDSINYAKRIQDSILPSHDELLKQFSDYFIFFRPKDIVSGDFYWLSAHNGKIIFAIADCTGHGVPGAFMSMIGNTLLNEIVNEKFIFQPAEILNQLNEGVVHALHQESRSQDDGMEISVCLFEIDKKKITFAGAGHSLIIVKNKIIEIIKGDVFSIGSLFGPSSSIRNENFFAFSQKEIPLSENQMLYFSTDGFADQRGGTGGKRFFTKQLEELLLNVSSLPIKTQEEKIMKAFENWKGNYTQQDDVLLAGIKL